MTKDEEKMIDDFEKLNGIKNENYLFAITKENEILITGKVSDNFVFDAVMRILVDHPEVMAMILEEFVTNTTMKKTGKTTNAKKDPNRKLN